MMSDQDEEEKRERIYGLLKPEIVVHIKSHSQLIDFELNRLAIISSLSTTVKANITGIYERRIY